MTKAMPNTKMLSKGCMRTRRDALKRLIGTGAYAVPVVASFSMTALSVDGFLQTAAAE